MPYKDKELQKKFQREWIANRRVEFFKDKSCVKCGSKNKMELDHINRLDKVSHRIWSWKEARRIKEIAKCQVLCNMCHKEKTKQQILELKRNKS